MAETPVQIARPRRASKEEQIALRASREQRELIARASELMSMTLSEFMLRASIASAEDVMADRREFRLPPDRWNAFVQMLDRPLTEKPRLRRLLTEPSVFDRS